MGQGMYSVFIVLGIYTFVPRLSLLALHSIEGEAFKDESMPAVLLFRSRPDKNHHSIQNCVILLAFFLGQ